MAQNSFNYWEQLKRLEKLIKNSELKAGVVFSFHSLIVGLFVDRLDTFKAIIGDNTILLVITILWIITVITSIVFCFLCFKPAIKVNYDTNVFFFKDAARKFENPYDYTEELFKVCDSKDEIYKLLAEQIHAESTIVDEKFANVQRSILFFSLSVFFIFLFAIFYAVVL